MRNHFCTLCVMCLHARLEICHPVICRNVLRDVVCISVIDFVVTGLCCTIFDRFQVWFCCVVGVEMSVLYTAWHTRTLQPMSKFSWTVRSAVHSCQRNLYSVSFIQFVALICFCDFYCQEQQIVGGWGLAILKFFASLGRTLCNFFEVLFVGHDFAFLI